MIQSGKQVGFSSQTMPASHPQDARQMGPRTVSGQLFCH